MDKFLTTRRFYVMRDRHVLNKFGIAYLSNLLSRWLVAFRYLVKGLSVGVRIWYEYTAFKRRLIVVHIQEIGLREHVEPVISWLLKTARCVILVVVPETQIETYRACTTIPYGRTRCLWIMSEKQFAMVPCAPAVILSLHLETLSSIAHRFAKTSTCRVIMSHGLSDKGVFASSQCARALADCDVVFLTGPTFLEGSFREYCKKNPDISQRLKFIEVGLPKTDVLLHHVYSRERVLKDLGLDPERRTMCYAPSYDRLASLEEHGLEIMRAMASLDANVIVKLHHCSQKLPDNEPWIINETGGKDWRKIVQNLEQEYPNLKLATGQDANPYLIASDVLISDVSGVAYEFLLLDRPIIFFDVPDFFAEYGKNGIHYWGRECGDVVANVDELITPVQRALENPNHKKMERGRMIERLVYSKGNATETSGRAILALAEQGLSSR